MEFDERSFFKEYLTPSQLEECVEFQKSTQSNKSLFIIAIERGYIDDKNLPTILKKLPQMPEEKSAPKKKRKLFGELCIEKGLATATQIDECLSLQKKLKDAGKHFRLGQILIEKKYIAVRQAQFILELQGKKILRCIPCDTKFNIRSYRSEKKYQCPKCKSALTSSEPSGSVGVEQSFSIRDSIDVDADSLSLLNKKVGDYEIVELLGEGGMADVYKVVNPIRKKPRALKVMKAQAGVERFNREFESAHALRHPHIIRVYETGKIESRSYFFMEYVDGGTLTKRIEKMGVIPLAEGLQILKQVTMGLKYAHENNIVHRDVKPSNILITRGANREIIAKITDFGIAKPVSDSQITVTGHLVGTFKYMSPEHIKGITVDGKNDIFGLGIVAYEMFTGQEPFKVDDPVGYLFVNIKETPPPVHQVNPDLPKTLWAIIDRMMAKDPKARYDASTLLRDIDRYTKHLANGKSFIETEDQTSVFFEKKGLQVFRGLWDKLSQKLSWTDETSVGNRKKSKQESEEIILDATDFVQFSGTEETSKEDTAKQSYELGLALIQKGELETAMQQFKNLIEFLPGSPWAHRAKKKYRAIKEKLKKDGKTTSRSVQKKK